MIVYVFSDICNGNILGVYRDLKTGNDELELRYGIYLNRIRKILK